MFIENKDNACILGGNPKITAIIVEKHFRKPIQLCEVNQILWNEIQRHLFDAQIFYGIVLCYGMIIHYLNISGGFLENSVLFAHYVLHFSFGSAIVLLDCTNINYVLVDCTSQQLKRAAFKSKLSGNENQNLSIQSQNTQTQIQVTMIIRWKGNDIILYVHEKETHNS